MKNKDNVRSFKEYKRRKRNKNKLGKIAVVGVIVFLSAIAIGNLAIYKSAANLKYEIHYLKKDLNKKIIKLEEAEVKNTYDYNLRRVEEEASENLDMIYPKESQKRYI